MTFPIFKKTSNFERLFIITALVVIGFIASAIIGLAVTMLFNDLSKLNLLRISQISSQLFVFVFPPLLYAILVKEKPIKSLGFDRIPSWSLLGILMMYVILPVNNILGELNSKITFPESMRNLEELFKTLQEQATIVSEQMLNVSDFSGLIINLIMIAGLAALGEELLFRSLLQPFMAKIFKNIHIGIFVTSAIFSFIHFEIYGFLPRFVMGMLLGYMFYYSRTIWIPILMHFANNATVVILYFLNNKGITNIDVETFGQMGTFPLILSIIAMAGLFWYTIRCSKKEFKNIEQ